MEKASVMEFSNLTQRFSVAVYTWSRVNYSSQFNRLVSRQSWKSSGLELFCGQNDCKFFDNLHIKIS